MENETKMLENQTYRKDYICDWLENNHISQGKFAEMLNIKYSTLRGYLTGNIETPPIIVLKKMARILGVTLDFLCYNDNDPDTFDEAMQMKWWLSPEITNYFMEYKSNYYKAYRLISDKDKNADYNKILKLLLTKKITYENVKMPIIELFNANVLTLFICTIIHDKTFMETFKHSFDKLSTKINSNKTQTIGNNEMDFTFNEILEKVKTQDIYRNAKNDLHDAIDELLEITLKETFDSIKPSTKLL